MARVTLTVRVVLPAVTVRTAVCVPTERLPRLTLAEIDPFPEPETGFSVSHGALSVTVQFPLEVTVIV